MVNRTNSGSFRAFAPFAHDLCSDADTRPTDGVPGQTRRRWRGPGARPPTEAEPFAGPSAASKRLPNIPLAEDRDPFSAPRSWIQTRPGREGPFSLRFPYPNGILFLLGGWDLGWARWVVSDGRSSVIFLTTHDLSLLRF